MGELDVSELLSDLALNIVALFILVFLGYFLRYRRWDQVVAYVAFNISLFTVSAALGASGPLNVGVGFGLFAVLSIVRLRSDEATQVEIGYTMVSLVLGLMAGLSGMAFAAKLVFSAVLVVGMLLIDTGGRRPLDRWGRMRIELDRVILGESELSEHLETVLGAAVRGISIREIDFVRDTMRLEVSVERSRRPA